MSMQAGKCDSFNECPFKTFYQLQESLSFTFEQMIELVEKSFSSKNPFTPQKICREFEVEDPWENVKEVPHVYEVKQ